ncbi:MAG TPA: DUF6220 domain-containing protein [Jatrophihabitantaceae bacterium]|jgi:Mn2+/Fe2+ NRAMP family transporter|nr:DUF6220 domain-containing protein [Jatrophihabitantaceae bacterium]
MTTTPTHAASEQAPRAELSTARRRVDTAFAVLIIAFTLAILVQLYLAGAGAFAHHGVRHPFAPHEDLGHYLGVASGVLLILALIARATRWTMLGSLLLVLTTEVAQEGLASAGHHNRWVGGLHAFDGGLILLLALTLAVAAYRRRFAAR